MGSHLWIRSKANRSRDLISSHISLTYDMELMPILKEKQRGAIAHFEDKIKISREDAL